MALSGSRRVEELLLDTLLALRQRSAQRRPSGRRARIMAELIVTVSGTESAEYAEGLLADSVGRDGLTFFDVGELLGKGAGEALAVWPLKIVARIKMGKARWSAAVGVERSDDMELLRIIADVEDDSADFEEEEELASYTMFHYYLVPLNGAGLRDMPRLLARLAGAAVQSGAGTVLKLYDFNKQEIQLPNDADFVRYDEDGYRLYVVYNVGKSDVLISMLAEK